jgi:hypothetical protein
VEQKRAETGAIRTMLEELIKFWPRGEGNGWFKVKVHEQLHVPGDISRNGSPRNTYTGPVENNHLDVKERLQPTPLPSSPYYYYLDYCPSDCPLEWYHRLPSSPDPL